MLPRYHDIRSGKFCPYILGGLLKSSLIGKVMFIITAKIGCDPPSFRFESKRIIIFFWFSFEHTYNLVNTLQGQKS